MGELLPKRLIYHKIYCFVYAEREKYKGGVILDVSMNMYYEHRALPKPFSYKPLLDTDCILSIIIDQSRIHLLRSNHITKMDIRFYSRSG